MSDEKDQQEVDYDLYDYKLVKFHEESEGPPADIDIVYKDWVYFNNKSGICETLFPAPPYGAIKRRDLFKKLHEKAEAPPQWLSYEIEIVGHAKTYDTALLRLEELKKKPFAFTDNENASKKAEAIVQKLKCRATAKNKNKETDFDDEVISFSEEEAECQQDALAKEKEGKRKKWSRRASYLPGSSPIKKVQKMTNNDDYNTICSSGISSEDDSTQEEVTKLKEKTIEKQKRNIEYPFTPKTGLKTPSTSWRKEDFFKNQSNANYSGRDKMLGLGEKLVGTPRAYSNSNHVEMEILRKLTGMESEMKFLRSEVRDIKQSIAEIQNFDQVARYRQNENLPTMNTHSFMEKYNDMTLPARTEEDLTMFSNKLNADREFSTDFEMAFFSLINRKKTLPVNLANIMRSVVTRQIARNYTALRKTADKRIFKISHPKLYTIIHEFLNRTREGEEKLSDQEFATFLGTCLTNAKDWDGQRKSRNPGTPQQ